MTKQTLTQLEQHELFIRRHIGSDALQQQEMLNYVGAESLEDLTAQIVPESIRLNRDLAVGEACGEAKVWPISRAWPSRTRYSRAT